MFNISAWALERMIEDHNKRFPDKPVRPWVEATDSPAIYKKADLEPIAQKYLLQRDLDSAILRVTMREVLRMFQEMRDDRKKLETLKAIRDTGGLRGSNLPKC